MSIYYSIKVGTPRVDLLSRYGAPISTKENDKGLIIDIFRVPEGESTGGKVAKGVGLAIVGCLTWGLSEIAAHPVTKGQK